RNIACHLFRGERGATVCGYQKINLAAHEVFRLFDVLLEAAAGGLLECDGATLDVTQIDQSLPEGTGTTVGLGIEHTDSRNASYLLRRGGKRRESETEREKDREPDPPHGHLGGGWLAGSLAEENGPSGDLPGPSRRASAAIELGGLQEGLQRHGKDSGGYRGLGERHDAHQHGAARVNPCPRLG